MIKRYLLPSLALAFASVTAAAPPPPLPPEEVARLKTFFEALPDRVPEQIERFTAHVSPQVKVYRQGKLAFTDRESWFAHLRSFAGNAPDLPRGISISREAFYRTVDGGIAVIEFAYPIAPAGMEGQITYHPDNPLQLVTYHLERGRLVRVDYGPPMRSYDYLLRKADPSPPNAAASPIATANDVISSSRLTPQDAIRTMKGRCGQHAFGIALRHDGRRNVLSLDVDGRAVARAEVAKVEQAVSPGSYLYEPAIAECFPDRANARMRLLTDGPNSGGHAVWISFEVSPEGRVSAVRND